MNITKFTPILPLLLFIMPCSIGAQMYPVNDTRVYSFDAGSNFADSNYSIGYMGWGDRYMGSYLFFNKTGLGNMEDAVLSMWTYQVQNPSADNVWEIWICNSSYDLTQLTWNNKDVIDECTEHNSTVMTAYSSNEWYHYSLPDLDNYLDNFTVYVQLDGVMPGGEARSVRVSSMETAVPDTRPYINYSQAFSSGFTRLSPELKWRSKRHNNITAIRNFSISVNHMANCTINDSRWVNYSGNGTHFQWLIPEDEVVDGNYSTRMTCHYFSPWEAYSTNADTWFAIDTDGGNVEYHHAKDDCYRMDTYENKLINFTVTEDSYMGLYDVYVLFYCETMDTDHSCDYSWEWEMPTALRNSTSWNYPMYYNFTSELGTNCRVNCYHRVTYRDTHTDNLIPDMDVEKSFLEKKIKFTTKGDERVYISVELFENPYLVKEIHSKKKYDRYQFGYDFLGSSKEIKSLKFRVKSNRELNYYPDNRYRGWLITESEGAQDPGLWFDLNLEKGEAEYVVEQKGKKEYEITMFTRENDIMFESVGYLNNEVENWYFDITDACGGTIAPGAPGGFSIINRETRKNEVYFYEALNNFFRKPSMNNLDLLFKSIDDLVLSFSHGLTKNVREEGKQAESPTPGNSEKIGGIFADILKILGLEGTGQVVRSDAKA